MLPAHPSPFDSILCDFDGTIAIEDVTDTVLAALAHPSWVEVEDAWKAGRIDARTCMASQVRLLQGDWDDVAAVADRVAVDPAFPRFAAWCRARGIALVITSDGLDFCIRRILGRVGLGDLPIRANHLVRWPDGQWRLETPFEQARCRARAGHCKCASIGEAGATIVIGDGRSDMCVAAAAGFVFAKDSLLGFCRERSLPHQPFSTFEDVIAGLEQMQARGALRRGMTKDVA